MRATITFDADMAVGDALLRLARYGFWTEPMLPAIRAWLGSLILDPLDLIVDGDGAIPATTEAMALRLRGNSDSYAAIIRRQHGARVLWYLRAIPEVLEHCKYVVSQLPLGVVLNLHESESLHSSRISRGDRLRGLENLVLVGARPAGAWLPNDKRDPDEQSKVLMKRLREQQEERDRFAPMLRRGPTSQVLKRPDESVANQTGLCAWPRLDAPEYVLAGKPFKVVVGLSVRKSHGVSGGQVRLPIEVDQQFVDLTIELTAAEIKADGGWTKTLRVPVAAPTGTTVSFILIGNSPSQLQAFTLTTLKVRFLVKSTVCGYASRPLIIGAAGTDAAPQRVYGIPGADWRDEPRAIEEMTLVADPEPPDITIEILKSENEASGRYLCRLCSPHPIVVPDQPMKINLGDDAKTFAKELVDQIRLRRGTKLLDLQLRAIGAKVARHLPGPVVDALHDVANLLGSTPHVLLVTAEPFVPWELALLDPPLDATRPSFLGAQTNLGRWLRSPAAPPRAHAQTVMQRPPMQPPSTLPAKSLGVMAGRYKSGSGLRVLPSAVAEATALVNDHNGIDIPADANNLADFLNAKMKQAGCRDGGVDIFHFAGHGQFDASRGESGLLYLSDSTELGCSLFEASRYGGARSPFVFLNACMSGIGGDVLGDLDGFPGNCLRGGFGAMLGALWEVDDTIAHDLALEFWRLTLPANGTTPRLVAELLAEFRSRYAANTSIDATCLSYVYYGHPRLRFT